MSQLNQLQQRLQHLYEVDVIHQVADFVTSDQSFVQQWDKDGRETAEKLLIRQYDHGIDLSLYLDAELVKRLHLDDPTAYLHDGNAADFCSALEGVSHFLYLLWNAVQGRSISCLELEMQAEVDKYISLFDLISRQRQGVVPDSLHDWLFAEPVFDQALNEAELSRYRTANHYAAKYCLHLQNRYLHWQDSRGGNLLNELRRFYRLSLAHKMRWIEMLH